MLAFITYLFAIIQGDGIMSTLLLTLAIAFVVVIVAIGLLAIGWLITGKSCLKPGACGRDPNQKKGECDPQDTCSLCEKPEEKKKDKPL